MQVHDGHASKVRAASLCLPTLLARAVERRSDCRYFGRLDGVAWCVRQGRLGSVYIAPPAKCRRMSNNAAITKTATTIQCIRNITRSQIVAERRTAMGVITRQRSRHIADVRASGFDICQWTAEPNAQYEKREMHHRVGFRCNACGVDTGTHMSCQRESYSPSLATPRGHSIHCWSAQLLSP